MRFRVDRNLVVTANGFAGQRIERGEAVDFVAEELDAHALFFVRRVDFDDVAADAKRAAPEVVIVPLVLDLDELSQNLIAADSLSPFERQQHAVVRLWRTEAVDARDAGDDDHVATLEERPGGREAHPVDFVVDRRFLLDVRIGRRHVGFRLVVVVVADEVFDGVVGEKAAEFLIELCGERLVVDHHQGRAVHARDGLRHGEGLAGSGDTEEDLMTVATIQPLGQLGNGAGLIPRQREI